MPTENPVQLNVSSTQQHCPIGETVGEKHKAIGSTPVLSCEGACIRGEIARQAANMVAKQPGFGRGCHGELFTVPQSAIAHWFHQADKVILIDGCFLRCHGRVLENMLAPEKLVQFDALSHYKKYTEVFDPDDVPPGELRAVARDVADWVLAQLADGKEKHQASACDQAKSACNCYFGVINQRSRQGGNHVPGKRAKIRQ